MSLLFIGGIGFLFSLLFRLSDVISAILAMRIVIQFVGQAIGVVLLRNRKQRSEIPFRMWLYPLPVIVSIIIWLFVFFSTGWYAISGLSIALAGVGVYYIRKLQKPVGIRLEDESSG